LQVTCECGEEITLDSAVRGISDTDRVLALLKCPKLKCDRAPVLTKHVTIHNALTMAIRRHMSKFYAGYVVCEDPACGGRTRQLPLHFRGAFPVCSTCGSACMSKEYTDKQLYTQLLYYQQLFDVGRAAQRYSGASFAAELSANPGSRGRYEELKAHVDETMNDNKYSIVDMTKLFGGFYNVKAASFRHKNRL
jgi:DNA polymerase alpha subunit A